MIHEIEIKLSIERFNELNNRRFKKGDLVYFINRGGLFTPYYYVDWGIVEDVYAETYGLKLYELRDVRAIDGIPIKDYNFESIKWRKLPKGWSYYTPLFRLTDEMSDDESEWREERCLKMVFQLLIGCLRALKKDGWSRPTHRIRRHISKLR